MRCNLAFSRPFFTGRKAGKRGEEKPMPIINKKVRRTTDVTKVICDGCDREIFEVPEGHSATAGLFGLGCAVKDGKVFCSPCADKKKIKSAAREYIDSPGL